MFVLFMQSKLNSAKIHRLNTLSSGSNEYAREFFKKRGAGPEISREQLKECKLLSFQGKFDLSFQDLDDIKKFSKQQLTLLKRFPGIILSFVHLFYCNDLLFLLSRSAIEG